MRYGTVCRLAPFIILCGLTPPVHGDAARLTPAVTVYLEALDDAQREMAALPFDTEERFNWHFVPRPRLGISFADMNEAQGELALDVLRAALSESGFAKVETIRQLEPVLLVLQNNPIRDLDAYYLTIFGKPGDKVWGLRYEGHHISLNWTIAGGNVVGSTPQFLGANPAEVHLDGPMKGVRALAGEEDLARALVKSLDPSQRAHALVSDTAPRDILSGTARESAILENQGIAYRNLDDSQQALLLSLIEEHASVQLPGVAAERLAEIRADGIEDIKFAWMGGLEKGEGHYYRVQGTGFLIEYDNVQNNANHIHTVWRDYDGDFGLDVLKQHYANHADPANPGHHHHD